MDIDHPFSNLSMNMDQLANLPMVPPPPGVASNFNDPETRARPCIIIAIICLSLIWPVVVMRVYSKSWVLKTFGWDDGVCTPEDSSKPAIF